MLIVCDRAELQKKSLKTSIFLFLLLLSCLSCQTLIPAFAWKKYEAKKCGWVGPCVVGLVGQVGAGHLTHPSPHLPHFVLLGFRKRCWFGKNGTIWMNKRCKEGENGVDEKEKVEKLGQKNMLGEKWCKNWVGGRGWCWWIEVLDAFRHLPILTFISSAQTNNLGILSLPVPINTFPCPSIFSFLVVHQFVTKDTSLICLSRYQYFPFQCCYFPQYTKGVRCEIASSMCSENFGRQIYLLRSDPHLLTNWGIKK